jgi:DNA-binding PadR family transcriptional regulator
MSDTGREVREYRITPSGRKRLQEELADYRRVTHAIETVLENA